MTIVKKTVNIALSLSLLLSLSMPHDLFAQELLASTEYLGLIQQKINANFIYPLEAQSNGWEGIAKVRFTLAKDGRIRDIDIAQSSGYPLLDALAILAVKDGGPYPFPEGYYTKQELELIIPVEFVNEKSIPMPEQTQPAITEEQEPQLAEQPEPQFLETPAAEETESVPQEEQEQLPEPPQPPEMAIAPPQEVPAAEPNTPILAQENQDTYRLTPPEGVDPSQANSEAGASKDEITGFINLALKNHEPTKVAREEIELAEIKVTEAKRSFIPGFKIQAYNTTGEVNKVDYEEREIKTQLDQPIYYSGRLKDTLDQSKVNLEITKKNYDRLKLDVIQKTEASYYNLVAAKINHRQKQEIYDEARDLAAKVENLFAIGMITELEMTSTRALLEQIGFQLDSALQESHMAELTFKQVLNLKDIPVVQADTLDAKKLDLDLNQCVGIAFKHRPELELSELLVRFNEYGQRIEIDKNNGLTVDLTGSYGYYSGHFKTEPWRDSNNWYGGIKISKPWGGNTINTGYNSEESQPRFGQTSPTASSTFSGEFNFLDNIRRLSDKKKADIELHRSLSDFDEAIKTVIFEVQDAFLNYQKSLLQLNTAELDIKYRANEVEVIKIRASVADASISDAIQALYSMSDAQSKYTQAVANYHISLSSLKKATGYGLQI